MGMRSWEWPCVLGLASLFALVITWPLFRDLDSLTLPWTSAPWDAAHFRWAGWWIDHCRSNGVSPLRTDLQFYPYFESLAYYPAAWTYALLTQPALWFLPTIEGVNLSFALSIFLSFAIAGFATYGLARHIGQGPLGAGIAAIAFATCGIRMTNLAQVNIIVSEFLPLVLWIFLSLARAPSRWKAGLLGLAMAALLYNSRDLTNQAFFLLVLVFLGRLVWPTTARETRQAVPTLCLAAAIALIFCLPWLYSFWEAEGGSRFAKSATTFLHLGSLDAKALFLPHDREALYGSFLNARHPMPSETEGLPEGVFGQSYFLGFTWWILVLSLIARPMLWKRAFGWALLGALFLVLALGPFLVVDGVRSQTFLPYATLYQYYPPIQLSRVPLRFLSAASVALSLLAGFGAASLYDHLARVTKGGRLLSGLFCGAVFILIPWESSERIPIDLVPSKFSTPNGYHRIAEDDEAQSLLELPYASFQLSRLTLYYQTVHEKPVYFCDYPRAVRSNQQLFEYEPFFSYLKRVQDSRTAPEKFQMPEPIQDPGPHISVARDYGVRYVTVHEFQPGAGQKAARRKEATDALCEALRSLKPAEEWIEAMTMSYQIRFFRLY